jgi:hypothetical protein
MCRTIARFLDRLRVGHHDPPPAPSILIDLLYHVTVACHSKADDISITFLSDYTIHLATHAHVRHFHLLLQSILWQLLQMQQDQPQQSLADLLEPPVAYLSGDSILYLQAALRYSLHCLNLQPVTLDLVVYLGAAINHLYNNDDHHALLLVTAQALAAAHRSNHTLSVQYSSSLAKLYNILEMPDTLPPHVIAVLHGMARHDSRIGILLLRHRVPMVVDDDDTATNDTNNEAKDIISLCRTLLLVQQQQQDWSMARPTKRRRCRHTAASSWAERVLSNAVLPQLYEPIMPARDDDASDEPLPTTISLATAIVIEACRDSSLHIASLHSNRQQLDALLHSAADKYATTATTTTTAAVVLSDELLHMTWAVYHTLRKIPTARFILGRFPVYLDEKRPHTGAVAGLRLLMQPPPRNVGIVSTGDVNVHHCYDEETKQCFDILHKLHNNAADEQNLHDLLELATSHPNAAIRYYLCGKLGTMMPRQWLLSFNEQTSPPPPLISARILGSVLRDSTTACSATAQQQSENDDQRLVQFWAHDHSNFRDRALAFGELGRFSVVVAHVAAGAAAGPVTNAGAAAQRSFRAVVLGREEAMTTETTTIGHKTEMLFELLSVLYRTTGQYTDNPSGDDETTLTLSRFDEAIPLIVREMVQSKNKPGLNLAARFRTYLLALQKARIKIRKRNGTTNVETATSGCIDILPPGCLSPKGRTISRSWQRNVDEQTRDLCLTPNLMEGIVPLLLIYATPVEMQFFMDEVLQGRISMKALLESRLVSILKIMVLRVGHIPMERTAVASALGRIAYTMRHDREMASYSITSSDGVIPFDRTLSVELVTQHFMYLLVNVAQFRWTSKSIKERTQALYALEFALDFLAVAEASQYFPQIMATANSALAVNLEKGQDVSLLWLAAIKVMEKYIHLCVESSWKTVGENLTALIVSLVPVLDEAGSEDEIKECQDVSIELLKFLTAGDLGKKLAEDFGKIPFIPRSSRLDPIRSALNSLGVVVDDLAALDSAEATQHENMSTSAGSEGGTARTSSAVPLQQALHRRLTALCPLLGNDNVRVRQVVLKHLTATLKENRKTFQNLVQAEGGVAAKRFVTLAKGKISSQRVSPISQSCVSSISRHRPGNH